MKKAFYRPLGRRVPIRIAVAPPRVALAPELELDEELDEELEEELESPPELLREPVNDDSTGIIIIELVTNIRKLHQFLYFIEEINQAQLYIVPLKNPF